MGSRTTIAGNKSFDPFGKYPLIARIRLGNYYDLIMNIHPRLFLQKHHFSLDPFGRNKIRSRLINFHHIKTFTVQDYLRQRKLPILLIPFMSPSDLHLQLISQLFHRHILRQSEIFNFQPGQIISGDLHLISCTYQKFQNET